jgi:hypothetical protein
VQNPVHPREVIRQTRVKIAVRIRHNAEGGHGTGEKVPEMGRRMALAKIWPGVRGDAECVIREA